MQEERTEEPSARRLQEAAAEGRAARSPLLPVALALSAALLLAPGIGAGAERWVEGFRTTAALLPSLSRHEAIDVGSVAPFLSLCLPALMRSIGGAAFVVSASVLFALVQSGFKLAPLALRPRWRKHGIAALTSALSRERWSSMLLGLGAIAALAVEAALWVRQELVVWTAGLPFTLQTIATLDDAGRLGWQIALTIALAGALELFQQRARHTARLRMTPREARDDRAR
ncbi:MAG: EscU/YscU/HrcU family type III secretion system export apparatus switch protein, partial [Candidatus Eremiobacteraeota bacterium]|nr:EscU/YscU/HrcU family type III secretion system export apparatus switch protein [Candidatus Eremiobacteraeota bacterium]